MSELNVWGWRGGVKVPMTLHAPKGGHTAPPAEPYDIVIGLVQSNMRGVATDFTASDQYAGPIYMWHHGFGSIVPAAEPQSMWENPGSANGMGASNTFLKDYAANNLAPGRRLLMINVARGGTGFTTPSSNSTGGTGLHWRYDLTDDSNNLARRAVDVIKDVLEVVPPGSRIVAFIANHGSTDGTNNTPKATFKGYLQAWITWLRSELNAGEVPYIMMQMRPDLVANETRHKNIDDAQKEVAAEGYKIAHALSPVGSQYYKADAVHFNAAGMRVIGHNMFQKLGVASTVRAGAAPIGTALYDIPGSNVIYVATNGNNANAGTLAAPKQTVAGAVSAATTGTTIVVRGGTYGALGTVNKSVTIQNYPGETVWFDGGGTIQTAGQISAANVTVRGVGFRRFNVTNDADFSRGLVAPGSSSGMLIENCHFEDFGANVTVAVYNGHGGINTFNSTGSTIRYNTFRRMAVYGIYTNRCISLDTGYNVFDGMNRLGHPPQPLAAAIKHCRARYAKIHHNVSINNPNCQAFWFDVSCYQSDIYSNDCEGGYEAILIELSGEVRVVNNRVRNGSTYGVRVLDSNKTLVGWNETYGGNPHVQLGNLQDERRNTGESYLAEGVTWLSRENQFIGNRTTGSFQFGQIGVYDYTNSANGGPTQVAYNMVSKVAGNVFEPHPTSGLNERLLWSHTAGATFSGRSLNELITAHPTIVQRANVTMPDSVADLVGVPRGGTYAGLVTGMPVPIA